VREVEEASEVLAATEAGPTLVLAGPSERRRLESMGSIEVHPLARGPRDNALLRVERREAPEHATVAPGVRGSSQGQGG
jgi:hypothetical protein